MYKYVFILIKYNVYSTLYFYSKKLRTPEFFILSGNRNN